MKHKDPQTGKEVDEESARSQSGETVLEDTVLRHNKDVQKGTELQPSREVSREDTDLYTHIEVTEAEGLKRSSKMEAVWKGGQRFQGIDSGNIGQCRYKFLGW